MSELITQRFDLHIHTTASDGIYTPQEIVKKAAEAGLEVIAITDHDTLEGVPEAIRAGLAHKVKIISGVELSTRYAGISVDILGYHIDRDRELNRILTGMRTDREARALKIIKKFCELGMPITFDDVKQFSAGSVIARPHIARAVVQKGYAKDVQTVFDEYLADGKPCAVDKTIITPQEGIDLIHHAGGLAVLAHPALIGDDALVEQLLRRFDFDGIEVWHRKQTKEDNDKYGALATKYELIMTGGSDFHHDGHHMGRFGLERQEIKC